LIQRVDLSSALSVVGFLMSSSVLSPRSLPVTTAAVKSILAVTASAWALPTLVRG